MPRICGLYGAAGALTALWGATLPATDARLDLGAGRLGGVLLLLAATALIAMPPAQRLAPVRGEPTRQVRAGGQDAGRVDVAVNLVVVVTRVAM